MSDTRAPEDARGIGLRGEALAGPPWIVGLRGVPLDAPENTLASLRAALELGLDGVGYDVRATAGGELVLFAGATLERTTNAFGVLAETPIAEVASLDAGGSFDARFRGERIPLLEEALELSGDPARGLPQHWVELHERGAASVLERARRELGARLSLRAASRSLELAREARDAGLEAAWIVDHASAREAEIARREGFAALAARRFSADVDSWPCERWAYAANEPAELADAARIPLHGILTHEPLRALAARALAHLAPHQEAWPVRVPSLEVAPPSSRSLRGEWFGRWEGSAFVENPFPFAVRATCGIVPRRGAFSIARVPVAFELEPGVEREVPFVLEGGATRPGGDPLFFARFDWKRGPGRPAQSLVVDAPLARRRTLAADAIPARVFLLRESPRDEPASLLVRRRGRHLFVSIESAGGLADARVLVHLDGRTTLGGKGLRCVLPEDFDARPEGVPFSCGITARVGGERVVRRWCGGLPEDDLDAGAPGVLVPVARA